MTLQEIHDRYWTGGMDMTAYVTEMQTHHVQLLDYAAFLPGSDIARIEITDGCVVLTSRSTGLKFRYEDRFDRYSALTLLNLGAYESVDCGALLRFAGALAGDGPFTFLDIGANGGWYALNLAQRFPAATVHAFEPVPATFRGLALNLEANGFSNVRLHNLGLMNEEGTQPFFFDPTISGRASARNLVDDPEALPVACPVTRLDTFARAHGLAPDVVKVDVEGAELMVFQGGLETLARHRPLIMAELLRKWARKFGYHPDAVIALLAGLGYRCFFLEEGKLVELLAMTEDVVATNFFFLHQDKHAALL
jgi:FkbM family methyltransferase